MTGRLADHWHALLIMTRLLGAAVAVGLLALHRVTDYDGALVALTAAYTAGSLAALRATRGRRGATWVWIADAAAVLVLIWLSRDWRSPFYLLALTALVVPVTTLPFRAAVLWGVAFAASYGAAGVLTERLGTTWFEDTIRLETVATHLMVPVLVALALGYASDLLRRLTAERERAEALAVQSERQRIAWELHDSAKQRVHAAHLVLSGLPPLASGDGRELVDHALGELRAAAADMDTSVGELRTPLEGRPLDELVRRRAAELAPASAARIDVVGSLPALAPATTAHSFRIVAEALTNAVRHAGARVIAVRMDPTELSVTVADDGAGLPRLRRPGSYGLRTMEDRARTIGARLEVGPGHDGRGTVVRLALPNRTTERTGS